MKNEKVFNIQTLKYFSNWIDDNVELTLDEEMEQFYIKMKHFDSETKQDIAIVDIHESLLSDLIEGLKDVEKRIKMLHKLRGVK